MLQRQIDEQPPGAAVAVDERMDRLEPGVHLGGEDDRLGVARRRQPRAQLAHHAGTASGGGGSNGGAGQVHRDLAVGAGAELVDAAQEDRVELEDSRW